MHSTLVRLQNFFGFFTTVGFVLAALVAASSFLFHHHQPASSSLSPSPGLTAKANVRSVQVVKGRAHQYYTAKQNEYAFIRFDLDADLTSLFHWNTKQVFAYLVASYPGHLGDGAGSAAVAGSGSGSRQYHHHYYPTNEAVIWDAIITDKSHAKISLRRVQGKYNIHDITGKFDAQNATLALAWNVQPHVGALRWGVIAARGSEGEGQGQVQDQGQGGSADDESWRFTFPMLKARQAKAVEKEKEKREKGKGVKGK